MKKFTLIASVFYSTLSFTQTGILNTAFSTDGADIQFGTKNLSRGSEVLVQNDGKIVVVGDTYTAGQGGDIHVYRYNTDGTLDSSFGTNGVKNIAGNGSTLSANCATLGAGNKILIAGRRDNVAQVIRLNSDGTMDTSFDGDGIRLTGFSFPHEFNDIVELSNGSIVCLGVLTNSVGSDFLVAKMNVTGNDDATFGTPSVPGYIGINFTNLSVGQSIHVNDDNTLLVAGYCQGTDMIYDIAVAKISAAGNSLVPTFGTNGKLMLSVNPLVDNKVYSMQVLSNSDILLGGISNSKGLICKLDSLGNLKTNFNATGYYTGSVGSFIHDLKIVNQNKIAAAGINMNHYDVFLFDTLGAVNTDFTREMMPSSVEDFGEFYSIDSDGDENLYTVGRTQVSENITKTIIANYSLVSSTAGISKLIKSNLSVYPNPSSGCVTVSVNKPTSIYIFSANGIELQKQAIKEGDVIDLSAFAAGIYMIRTIEGDVIKLIKE